MTLKQIALHNLRRRKSKAAFIFLGLVIGVSSVVACLSLVNALSREINHKLEKYGANILVLPRTENLSLSYGGFSLGGISFDVKEIRQEELSRIRSIKNAANVAAVGPMVLGPVTTGDQKVLLAGMDFESAQILRPWWKIRGRYPDRNSLLAGAKAARVLGLGSGSRIALNGRDFEVSGVLESTGSQDDHILFAPLGAAQTLLNKEGRISMAEVAALCTGCPIDEMVAQISRALPGAKVMAIKQVVQGRMETLDYLQKFAYSLSVFIILVGGLVVLITMLGSVRERISEFGIFSAIGFKRKHIMQLVLFEASAISAIAGVFGYVLGFGATRAAVPFFAESRDIVVSFDPAMAAGVFVMSICLGIAASAYPAWLAAGLDPNRALRTL